MHVYTLRYRGLIKNQIALDNASLNEYKSGAHVADAVHCTVVL
jgi:hypothetical protein